MTYNCMTCGKPAFPHPYRHPLTLPQPKTPFELEQALKVDAQHELEQMANVAAEWKRYYWDLLHAGEARKAKLCDLMERCAKAMFDGDDDFPGNPYQAAFVLEGVAQILDIPTPHEILTRLCDEADQANEACS